MTTSSKPPATAAAPARSLLRSHRGFRLLLTGDTVSQFGSQVTVLAIPLVALSTFHASAFQMGLLTAASTVPVAVAGLPAGAWVDRMRRRPILVAADLLRFALLASIPLAHALGVLTLAQLYAVAVLAGTATVFFDVAHLSYLPFLVGRDRLTEGNAVLQTANRGAEFSGPAVCGWLVQAAGPVGALLVDAVSFLVSAASIGAIRRSEPQPETTAHGSLRRQIAVGLRYVLSHPMLRMLVSSGVLLCLATTALLAVQPILLVRDLGMSPGLYGLLLVGDGIGGFLGSMAARPVIRRLGTARTIWVPSVAIVPFVLLLPFTGHGWLILLFPVGSFVFAVGISLRNVAQLSYRQGVCPPELLGRMNASMRVLTWGAMPLGGLLGGALAQWAGTRAALWAVFALIVLSLLPVLTPALRNAQD
ncbi:MFS transporter [Kitasatospora sp. NPDC056783]|uniref:MFS transporter n=1 Tax=Kitasatospora sp. NPDC056783 TaxID=3345943 RepID=UPI0036C4DD8D